MINEVRLQNAAIALLGDVYTVKVQFRNGRGANDYTEKTYTYMSDRELVPGDICIVDSVYGGLTMVRVTECSVCDYNIHAEYDYKFIVDVVNQKRYNKLMDALEKMKTTLQQAQRKKLIRQFREEYNLDDGDMDVISKLRKKFFK